MASSLFVSWGLLFSAFIALLCAIIYAIRQGTLVRNRIYLLEDRMDSLCSKDEKPEFSSEEELNEDDE